MRLLPLFLLASVSILAGEGGSLSGTVKFDGDPPKPAVFDLKPEKKGDCKHDNMPDDTWVVNPANKGLRWVSVRIMTQIELPKPAQPFVVPRIDQKLCVFSPRVTLVAPGIGVEVLNPEGIAHNAHTIPLEAINLPFNRIIPADQKSLMIPGKRFLEEPEYIRLQCDMHGWMVAWIVVHDPRLAAITDADGKFKIDNLPAGKHKVLFNHEGVEQEKEFEIKAGADTNAGEILFKKK
jgi:hypothetical protein